MKQASLYFTLFIFLFPCLGCCESTSLQETEEKPYVIGSFRGGRLGNQLFQLAAAMSVAIDNDAEALFPFYQPSKKNDIPSNLLYIFPNIKRNKPFISPQHQFCEDETFNFVPIPYFPNMEIKGFFQSEKYFKHNWERIYPYFAPSEAILQYLQKKYCDLCTHPQTVALHVRSYLAENKSLAKVFVPLDSKYFEEAASVFPEDALFVVFSDKMSEAKKLLKNFHRPHVFVEKETYYHDFYLMSLMKHQIISNSTFSWWAAYLNRNPEKIVIAPNPWFHPSFFCRSEHIVPNEWIKIPVAVRK